jgi:hypothetical protein
VREIANQLVGPLARHEFSDSDLRALAASVIVRGHGPDGWRFSHAEQTTMALEAIVTALKSSGLVSAPQNAAIETAMKAVYASFGDEASVRPEAFAAALREVRRAIGQ